HSGSSTLHAVPRGQGAAWRTPMDSPRRHGGIVASGHEATRIGRRDLLALGALGLALGLPGTARAAPAGQLTWGIHISLAPTWFEPAEASGVITPFMAFYARHVRFQLKETWPDFLTFDSTMTGAGWIVPRKYVEKVGDEGFKKAPVGAGPYKFVSFNPGVELVFEAFDQYWRKPPSVKRLIF